MPLRSVVRGAGGVLQRVSPSLYKGLIGVATSETSRRLRELHNLPNEKRLQAALSPRFAVDVRSRMGLGATLSWTVGVLAYCELHGLEPVLRFSNPLYASVEGEDWLDRYFIRQHALKAGSQRGDLEMSQYLLPGANLIRRLRPAYDQLTLKHSGELLAQALSFREEILHEVDRFCGERGVGLDTVAVHYRGTDKMIWEAETLGIAEVLDVVEQALDGGQRNLFVASDEPAFMEASVRRFGREQVVDLDCKQIYAAKPAHYEEGNNDQKAREALMTMLVLSRSGRLIRSRSHLSAWSKILSPALPTVTLGKMRPNDQFRYPEPLFNLAPDVLPESCSEK